ncbi:putative porin [Selenomonas sp. AE3005]|uniref:putative porin n=1 Tax=Selenomonas sp. AE3005 TaxID=1485543 RepID=UPI0004867830|nr:putative porin [Selenomonas sp. AE3005]
MKKTLVSALTTALVVGAASTTFAAANPFSDVPADHWAYDAVSQLAADGVIEGYGDSTFKGNRNITRYEMAQMVAKAMAKNTSGVDKALVDKLAAEFAAELNNLGVRVANLERNADKVKWNGTAEYTFSNYTQEDRATDSQTNNFLFRLEPSAEVNSNWHVKARLDANINSKKDAGDDNGDKVELKRIWAEGKYNNVTVKLGKFATPDDDTIADTAYSGAEVAYAPAQGFNAVIGAGRLKTNAGDAAGVANGKFGWDDKYGVFRQQNQSAAYAYVGVGYKKKKFDGALRYHYLAGDGFNYKYVRVTPRGLVPGVLKNYSENANEDKAGIWLLKANYNFTKDWGVKGFYAQNQKADFYKKAYSFEVDYKGAKAENKGSWGVWAAYRYFGNNAFVATPWDVIRLNQKGFEIGGNYALFKNTVITLRYGHGKTLNEFGDSKTVNNYFARVNFFF